MSESPADLTLTRVNRLTQAMADLMDSHAAQGRAVLREIAGMRSDMANLQSEMAGLRKEVRELSGETALLGNRVEEAISRALRVDLRMDEAEDRA